jgi:hypothetical protein
MKSLNRIGIHFSFCLSLLICAIQSPAATYYTATDGDNLNPGTSELPWLTIQKAADTMLAGDTVVVRAGSYNERVSTSASGGSNTDRITFQAEANVIMKGWKISHAFITVDGFEITGWSDSNLLHGHVEVTSNGNNFQLLNNAIRDGIQIVREDMVFSSTGTITSATGGFLAAGFAAGQTVYLGEATNTVSLLNSGTRLIDSVTDNTITVFGGLSNDGPVHTYLSSSFVYGLIVAGADNCVIKGNTFSNLGYDTCWMGGDANLFESNLVERCNGWDAIHFSGADHTFRANHFRNSPLLVYQVSPDLFENWTTKYERILFTDNFIENFVGVISSQKHNATGSGPLLFAQNVFVDVGRFSGRFPNTTIENNTFLRVATQGVPGILSLARHPVFINASSSATNAIIRNNIFIDCGEVTFPYSEEEMGWYDILGPADSAVTEGNFVASAPVGYAAKIGWPESDASLNGGDPGFVDVFDPVGPDAMPFTMDDGLQLLPGSKLIGAGYGGVDIGAYAPVLASPLLDIVLQSGDQFRISWPWPAEGFALQSATTVTGVWTNVPATPAVEENMNAVTIGESGNTQFFQLSK